MLTLNGRLGLSIHSPRYRGTDDTEILRRLADELEESRVRGKAAIAALIVSPVYLAKKAAREAALAK